MKTTLLIPSFALAFALTGCSTLGPSTADLLFSGAGGAIGYEASGRKIGGAALGAGGGYIASKLLQGEYAKQLKDAEKLGYDRAMNQSVKQQYWVIQNQQKRTDKTRPEPRYISVRIPETVTADGVILKPTTATLRTE